MSTLVDDYIDEDARADDWVWFIPARAVDGLGTITEVVDRLQDFTDQLRNLAETHELVQPVDVGYIILQPK